MSETCTIENCARNSCAICLCCQKYVCHFHFDEHHNSLQHEFDPLPDQFNSIHNRLQDLTANDLIDGSRRKLFEWRDQYHQKINDIVDQKCNELEQRANERIEKLKSNTAEMRKTLSQLIQGGDINRRSVDSIKFTVRNLEQIMDYIEAAAFDVTIPPITFDPNSIRIQEFNEDHLKLLTFGPAVKAFDRPLGSYASIAANDQYLLFHQKSDLCLVKKESNEVKRSIWKNEKIQSMCWSEKLEQFIGISEHSIFFVDQKLREIKKVQDINNRVLYSCTCSNTSLFVSTYGFGSSILQYKLLPKIEFDTDWKSPQTCDKDEWINDMSYNDGSIALVIKNPPKKIYRIKLRDSRNFNERWNLQLDVPYVGKNAFACCLLATDGWIVIDPDNQQLLFITKDGTMGIKRAYSEPLWCANMFGSDILAVTTDNSIKFHKL